MDRVFRAHNGRLPRDYREDFCGTAALATAFLRRRPEAHVYGVDLHRPTLYWGLTHHVARLEPAQQRRITLLKENVLTAVTPPMDVVTALNFSYSVFKTRALLADYFRAAHRALRPGGTVIVDAFGGTEAVIDFTERRRMAAGTTLEGDRVPPFLYIWEQARFNVVDHHILCHIHFELKDGTKIPKAFTYDWRLWSLPELTELMTEAGFRTTEVYLHGWDEESGTSDGVYRRRTRWENAESWIAYVVGVR